MKKLWIAAITAVLLFFGGIAQATPIVNTDFQLTQGGNQLQGESVAQTTPITISNFQFTWGNDQYEDGIGWIWDMDSVLEPFQVRFNKTSLIDPLGAIIDWITPLSYTEGSYVFAPIHLEFILDGVYYTSIGKGEWFSGGSNPFNDGVTFSGVGLEITQVSAVPEPPSFSLLIAGLMLIGLIGQWRRISARQYGSFRSLSAQKIRTRAQCARVLKLFYGSLNA